MNPRVLGYEEAGPPDGEVLLLIHGFPLDRRMWRNQLRGLADIRRVVAVDLRGRGLSQAGDEGAWTLQDLAGDIADTLAGLGVEKADIGGLSMGGYICFALWRRHPELFRTMALIDTKSTADPPGTRLAREQTAEAAAAHGTGSLAPAQVEALLAPGAPEALRSLVTMMIAETPGATAAKDALAMRDRPDSTPALGSINVPAIVINGTEDALSPIEGARAMAAGIPGCRFAGIPGAGHLAPLENPEAVNEALRGFLA